uniref:Uncharacterized protein n=1 Tax=Trichogramma kaykai TaxID=54128 RepID=A0ABD2XE08_9HYME
MMCLVKTRAYYCGPGHTSSSSSSSSSSGAASPPAYSLYGSYDPFSGDPSRARAPPVRTPSNVIYTYVATKLSVSSTAPAEKSARGQLSTSIRKARGSREAKPIKHLALPAVSRPDL